MGSNAGEILRQHTPIPDRRVEDERETRHIAENPERSRSVADLECDVSLRHMPGPGRRSALLRGDGHRAVGKASRKDEGPLSDPMDLRQIEIARDTGWCSLPDSRTNEIALPCLTAIEDPAVSQNILADLYRS